MEVHCGVLPSFSWALGLVACRSYPSGSLDASHRFIRRDHAVGDETEIGERGRVAIAQFGVQSGRRGVLDDEDFETIFEPGVESIFYWFSGGCPRLISLLADRVLLAAFSRQLRPIPAEFVESKSKSMGTTRNSWMREDLGARS